MTKILVIEDNADLAFGLRNNLEIEGYEVQLAHDGNVGLASALAERLGGEAGRSRSAGRRMWRAGL